MVQRVKSFLEEHRKNQRWLADSIGVNQGQLSAYLHQKYAGDVQSIEAKLENFIRNFIPAEAKSQEEQFYIDTKNTKHVHSIMSRAIQGVRLSAIFGNAGYGKTTAIKAFIKSHPEAIYIKINNLSTLKNFLQILCDRLNLGTRGGNMEMYAAIVEALSSSGRFLVIDEAEWLKDKALDTIRNLWEESKTPIILSGTLNLQRNLIGAHKELEYVNSRVCGRYTLQPLSESEFKRIAEVHGIRDVKLLRTYGKENFRTTMHLVDEAVNIARLNGEDAVNEEMLKTAYQMIG